MAQVPVTLKNSPGALSPASIAIGTAGDTLVWTPNAAQELILFNTSGSDVIVTIDGANGTTINVPGAGGLTVSIAAGLPVTVTAGKFVVLALDKVPAYLQGVVAITAATGAVVQAAIIQ